MPGELVKLLQRRRHPAAATKLTWSQKGTKDQVVSEALKRLVTAGQVASRPSC